MLKSQAISYLCLMLFMFKSFTLKAHEVAEPNFNTPHQTHCISEKCILKTLEELEKYALRPYENSQDHLSELEGSFKLKVMAMIVTIVGVVYKTLPSRDSQAETKIYVLLSTLPFIGVFTPLFLLSTVEIQKAEVENNKKQLKEKLLESLKELKCEETNHEGNLVCSYLNRLLECISHAKCETKTLSHFLLPCQPTPYR
jgi:hypothetical protein